MTRPTIKLPPKPKSAQPAHPTSSRARRAQHDRRSSGTPLASTRSLLRSSAREPASTPAAKAAAKPASNPAPKPGWQRPAANAAPPPQRASATPLVPENPRLSKRMSELGLCSRREADEWIENGWVKVDGQVTAMLGTRVPPDARIEIDAAAHRHQSESVTILLHKPVGYVSGQAEDGYEPASVLLRPENRWTEDRAPHAMEARAPARPRARRPARHRFDRPPGVHAGRARRAPADRPRLRGREGIPGAGRGHARAARA